MRYIMYLTWNQRYKLMHFLRISQIFFSRIKLAINLTIALFALVALVGACSYFLMSTPTEFYLIGCDRNWYPAQLNGKEQALLGFAEDLLQEISKKENVPIKLYLTGSDHLVQGLDNKEFDGILSAMTPTVSARSRYLFSKPFYAFGLVLVVPVNSTITSFKQMEGKTLGIHMDENSPFSLSQYPSLLIRPYPNILQLLNDVGENVIDGAILSALHANAYITGLHTTSLKIVTDPLTDKGLRLVTRLDGQELIDLFNNGLDELAESHTIERLMKKWNIN